MAHRPGPWRIGTNDSQVVCDTEIGQKGWDDLDYYGGSLICESIPNRDEALLIAAAADYFEAMEEGIRFINILGSEILEGTWLDKLRKAHQKAKGVEEK